jgi:steroid 5-alpha reductase family enzyme
MFGLYPFLTGFAVILSLAFATWCVSLFKRDVSIVDSMWPLFFVVAALADAVMLPQPGPRPPWVLALVGIFDAPTPSSPDRRSAPATRRPQHER